MPGDSFAFAVFIGGEPDSISLLCGFFEVFDDFLVVVGDFVGDIKVRFVDLGVFSDVADGGEDFEISAEILLYGFGFGGAFDDNKVFAHGRYNNTLFGRSRRLRGRMVLNCDYG